ncbi:Bifunctional solanapyrone synthase [Escovopsis weberi]|uniref:Bifunctional solanapyrone synthase n=1 Tax=Escovopsis weberi TaxID=150374 RepID=A0A0M9VRK2_ESCWE|nr:Bifunctional solanapyrone synthase [Escovopsis weberi]
MKSNSISLVWAGALAAGAFAQQSTPCYEASVGRWSGTSILQPACVFLPMSAEDISAAFKVIVDGQCQFATKSGGHNANKGANSIDGGISIDLKHVNDILLSDDKSVVTVGTGNIWINVYNALEGSGVAAAGALDATPGVGGLSIGGGLSIFSPTRGWIVDTVRNYRIVLPSGDIVNANATSNPDLYKASKGGGSNFGIVTHVDLETGPFTQLWGGLILCSLEGPDADQPTMIEAAGQAVADTAALSVEDSASALNWAVGYFSNNGGRVLVAALANTEDVENAPALEPWLSLPNPVQTQIGHMNLTEFTVMASGFEPAGFREVTGTITIKADQTTLNEILTQGDAIYDALAVKDQVDWIIYNSLMPKAQQAHSATNGGNVLGLTDDDDTIFMWFNTRWTDPSLDDIMADVRDQWIALATSIAEKNGALVPYIYVNSAGPNQDPLCSYGSENVDLMRAVAQKYDEQGVMQKLNPGWFKLADANC